MTDNKKQISNGNSQPTVRGSVLILALVFLLLTSLVASSTFFSTFSETRKAGNFAAALVTFEASEAALRQTENQLIQTNPRPAPTITSIENINSNLAALPIFSADTLASLAPQTTPYWQYASKRWWETYGTSLTSLNAGAQDSLVIVAEIDFAPDSATLNAVYGQTRPGVVYYEINSSTQGNLSSTATLQSTLGARYN
jgi:type IV pilus assembly protein PilX